MPRVSKVRLSDGDLQRFYDVFNSFIKKLDSKQKSDTVLLEFLTPEEKTMLSKRLVIYIMLLKKYDATEIQSALHVSYETIRSYKNQLIFKKPEFIHLLKTLSDEQQTVDLMKKLDNILSKFDLILQSKSNIKSRAKVAQGDFD